MLLLFLKLFFGCGGGRGAVADVVNIVSGGASATGPAAATAACPAAAAAACPAAATGPAAAAAAAACPVGTESIRIIDNV